LICLVQADRGEFRQALDERPLSFCQRMAFGIQNQERAEKPRITDQREHAKAETVFAGFHHRGSKLGYRIDALEIKRADVLLVAFAVGGEYFEITGVASAEDQRVSGVTLLHNGPAKKREYAVRRCRIGNESTELNEDRDFHGCYILPWPDSPTPRAPNHTTD